MGAGKWTRQCQCLQQPGLAGLPHNPPAPPHTSHSPQPFQVNAPPTLFTAVPAINDQLYGSEGGEKEGKKYYYKVDNSWLSVSMPASPAKGRQPITV